VSIVRADEAGIGRAVELLRQGKLVAIPTETVYGLGADAKNTEAVKCIFAAKGRPVDHPLIVHIPDKAALSDWAIEIPDCAWKLVDYFWPGPLTIVLKKHPEVPVEVTGGQNTIALRVPAHPVALELLKAFGGGIAAPSANRFCRISPTQAIHVEQELGDKVDLILDGGECLVGLESTIVNLSGPRYQLLRPGQITKAEIEAILQHQLELPKTLEKIHVPGAMEVHYAPDTPTFLCSIEQIQEVLEGHILKGHNKFGVLTFNKELKTYISTQILTMPENSSAYGHDLYNALRQLDNASIDIILVENPPQTEAWSAVNDRLKKAAKPFNKNLLELTKQFNS
jgi:L-threonylcarbamoyladenylate synthase